MRTKIIYLIFLTAIIVMAFGCDKLPNIEAHKAAKVAYPEGYRSWTRVKSMVILEGHEHFEDFGGFHHVYANDVALKALKQHESFPRGSVLVFELYEKQTENNAIIEGPRLVIGVMEKDLGRFEKSEGWGFEDFKFIDDGYRRQVTDSQVQCLTCHKSQKTNDFVYSQYRK